MAFQQKDGTGSLFKNDKKEKDTDPDYKGSALINGVDCWIGSWLKVSKKNGVKYMSLSFTPKNKVMNKGAYQKSFQPQEDAPF